MAEEDSEEVILEMNKRINNLNYTFRVDAPLKNYIHSKTNSVREIYTLAQLLTILKNIIGDEGLYDPRNTYIILCDTAMEAAFDLPGMHVTEIREFVFRQLELLPEEYQNPVPIQQHNQSVSEILPQETANEPTTSTIDSEVEFIEPRICSKVYSNKNARFRLKPDFYDLLSVVPSFDKTQTLFAYDEVTELLSKYILSKKDSIFDLRHVKLALVKNDPLGKVFAVDAFHRLQVTSMLRKQLIYVLDVSSEDSSSTQSIRKVKFG